MHHLNFKAVALCGIAISLISISLNGQQLNYKEYIFPEVKYKTLQLNEDLLLTNNSSSQDLYTRFRNNLNALSTSYINKGNSQFSSLNTFGSFIVLQKEADQFTHTASTNNHLRKYNEKKQFIEYELNANVGHYSYGDQYQKTLNSGALIGLKVGKGRIDVLNELMLAEFIIDDLRKDGLLTGDLDQTLIFALAKEIAQYRFTRILDSRNYRVQVLKGLSKWMVDNFPVKENSEIEISVILTDNFLYAGTGFRTIGSRIAIGLEPNISFSQYFKPNEVNLKYGANVVLEYSIQKPISRLLQSNFYAILNCGINSYDYDKSLFISNLKANQFNPNAILAYSIGYYPNSRTNIDLLASVKYGLYSNYIKKLGSSTFNNSDLTSDILPRIQLQASYFVNYRLRLFASLEVLYYHRINEPVAFPGNPYGDFVPDDFSVQVPEWYIAQQSTQLRNLNTLNTYQINNKVSYGFNAGFVFSLY